MAFFEDWGKKVGDFTQTAVKKSSNMVEITKLNNSISNEEKSINALFFELGRNYYASHGADADLEGIFLSLCSTIKQHENNIKAFREKIIQIKDMNICPTCGNELDKSYAFCDKCGTKMPADTPAPAAGDGSSSGVCPNCGNQVDKSHAFCDKCGTRLPDDTTPPAVSDNLPLEACPTCGNRIEKGQTFCASCGTKISENAPVKMEEDQSVCPNCNSPITDDVAFCIKCGTKVK